jgi:hypothetical protein
MGQLGTSRQNSCHRAHTRSCKLNVLVGIIKGGPDQSRHAAVHDDEVLVAVALDARDAVDEGAGGGNHAAAGLDDERQAFLLHALPHRVDQIFRAR